MTIRGEKNAAAVELGRRGGKVKSARKAVSSRANLAKTWKHVVTRTKYRVAVGYSMDGRERFQNFPTLEAAQNFCERVFQNSGAVLSIVAR